MYAESTWKVNSACTARTMATACGILHHAYMATDRKPHFLREHRKAKGLTLEQVAERIELLSLARRDDPGSRPKTMTHATLSRIERGKLPYNQPLLEMLAEIYGTDAASLIIRNPERGDALWTIWDQLQPVERDQLAEMAKVLHRRAG